MHRKSLVAYDQSADQFSKHYDEIGPREGDIALAFALAGNPRQARVLELGCGNGRDAKAILAFTTEYTGIDSSKKMISIARARLPEAHFKHCSVHNFTFDGPYDIVFALALIRYMNLEEVTDLLSSVYKSLHIGGILYISSTFGLVHDVLEQPSPIGGTRHIYTYNPSIIKKHAPHGFKTVHQMHDIVDGQEWFEIALQKVR